jgi:hypothetical protein
LKSLSVDIKSYFPYITFEKPQGPVDRRSFHHVFHGAAASAKVSANAMMPTSGRILNGTRENSTQSIKGTENGFEEDK